MFREQPDPHQLIKVFGCSVAMHHQLVRHKFNLGIGMTKQVVNQILAVNLGQSITQGVLVPLHQRDNADNQGGGLP